jgi:hypothetical protein
METETVEEVRTRVRMNPYLGIKMTTKKLNRDTATVTEK